MFITLEGGEGAGKSTQVTRLAASFKAAGLPVLTTREPGGSKGAEAIRKLVVEGKAEDWNPTTEALLFMAARYDHLETLIKPALTRGDAVLCDRFFDSTYVYQGIAKGVGTDWLMQLYSLLYGNLAPDLTLLLDLDPRLGLARASSRGESAETRFEKMELEFHQQLRDGFLALAKANPERISIVDAAQTPDSMHRQIIAAINQRFGLRLQENEIN
jgi:dTMP kinase